MPTDDSPLQKDGDVYHQEDRTAYVAVPGHRYTMYHVKPIQREPHLKWAEGAVLNELLSCKTQSVIARNIEPVDVRQTFVCPDCGGTIEFR